MAADYESIATRLVGAGGSNSLSFTSIPSTYTHLQLRFYVAFASSGDNIWIRFNNDTANNYSNYQMYAFGNGSVLASQNQSTNFLWGPGGSAANFTTTFAGGILNIYNYKDTTKFKQVNMMAGFDANATNDGYSFYRTGVWRTTTTISSIQIITANNNNMVQNSHIALYGLKV